MFGLFVRTPKHMAELAKIGILNPIFVRLLKFTVFRQNLKIPKLSSLLFFFKVNYYAYHLLGGASNFRNSPCNDTPGREKRRGIKINLCHAITNTMQPDCTATAREEKSYS